MTLHSEFILYACPVGPLAQQIERYFEKSRDRCGPNAAHAYMPHCTLTGFFRDEMSAIATYTQALNAIFSTPSPPLFTEAIHLKPLAFSHRWHGIPIASDQLIQIATAFVAAACSPTRTESIRLKLDLHLSLAYQFDPACERVLKQLATSLIDSSAPVGWELRFYERCTESGRTSNRRWRCHFRRTLQAVREQ